MAPLQFGILMLPYQVIDVSGPLDILSCCSKEMFASIEATGMMPPGLSSKAVDIEFHHINETLDPVLHTFGLKSLPTTTCDECPPLDYLIVGGPDPARYQLSERFARFIKDHVAAGKGLFATCTGALALSPSGVLDGKKATTNHQVLQLAKQVAPKVDWVKEQWVANGKIWTAGGACAGMDMMAAWVLENYESEVAQIGFGMLDFEPRDIEGKRLLLAEK